MQREERLGNEEEESEEVGVMRGEEGKGATATRVNRMREKGVSEGRVEGRN